MTCVMPRATSVSPGVPPTKSGIAIGSGATLPCVTSRRVCPMTGAAHAPPAEAAAPSASRRRRVSPNGDRTEPWVMSVCIPLRKSVRSGSATEHVARIEVDDDILPGFVLRHRKERIGRTGAHRAQRAFGGDLEGRMAAAVHQPRIALQAAVLLEQDAHRHDKIARLGDADRDVPALAQ